jgi:hypothetical protein
MIEIINWCDRINLNLKVNSKLLYINNKFSIF